MTMKPAIDNVSLYIIVADGDVKDHELVKKAVKECDLNYIVTSVFDGFQLLNLLLKRGIFENDTLRAPDIIIIDSDLKGIDGFEVLRQLKKMDAFRHIPVHVLSKRNLKSEEEKALELGACGFHAKPWIYHDLVHLVKNICDSVAA